MRYPSTRLWSLVIATAVLFGIASTGRCAESKIAVADFALVLKEFHKTGAAEQELERLKTEFKDDLEEMKKQLGLFETAFEEAREKTRNPMLNEEGLRKQRTEAEEKLIELKEYEQEILKYNDTGRKNLRDQSMRITKRLSDEILEVIKQYAGEKKLDLVLDSGELGLSGRGLVLHSAKTMDITDQVIAELNKGR
jgi:outer membrane protein